MCSSSPSARAGRKRWPSISRSSPSPMRHTVAVVAAAGLLLVAVRPAAALSTAEIRAQARGIGGASGDAASEQQRVAQLGQLTLAFIDQSDSAARAGNEGARRDELRGAFEAISGPLDSIYSS